MSRILVVGGGIVGTAIAADQAERGHDVVLICDSPIGGGATAAGMGHLIALDGEAAKVELTNYSLDLWRTVELPDDCDLVVCGALWVAADDREMQTAAAMRDRYLSRGIGAELIPAAQLAELEPELRPGLAGGLRVPTDAVLYPPNAARYYWHRAVKSRARHLTARVLTVESHRVQLRDDSSERWLEADWVVVAAGDRTSALLPELSIRPKKGHVVITTRDAPFVRHQVVELGYVGTTKSRAPVSVACNVQPRRRGQVLIGSSRQEDTHDPRVEPAVLDRMLRRAASYFPGLTRLTALRAWTGFRAVSEDGAPIIGSLRPGLAVATGHEGLGITQAPGTARLLGQLLAEEPPDLSAAPFDPHRFGSEAA